MDLIVRKRKCKKCKIRMIFIGVNEKGETKYHCPSCYVTYEIMEEERPPYVTIMSSIGGPKAVLFGWNDEFDAYEPINTGPGMKRKQAIMYAKDWAKSEGIEYKGSDI